MLAACAVIASIVWAQRGRAPIQNLVDAVSAVFVPAVIAVSAAALWAGLRWGPEPRWAFALTNAVSVLVVACPCALGLATPMSLMVALGRGAREGVLVRAPDALQKLAKVDLIAFDKTGTLTEGRPRLSAVTGGAGVSRVDALRWAAALARGSVHPLSDAVVRAADGEGVVPPRAENARSVPGEGVYGTVEGRGLFLG